MRYWLDGVKKGRLVEPRPRKDEPLKPARPLIEPPVCMGGSVPQSILVQQLMSDFIIICNIFDLFGNVVSKQRISKFDFLSTQMSIIFRNLRLQCLPTSLN